jgi:ParB/RepB/Spo0J family partition protein
VSETKQAEAKPSGGGGINAWIGKKSAAGGLQAASPGQPLEVELDLLDANPKQPRQEMEEGALLELVDSIRLYGVIQPITVTRQGARYTILAGHRRTEAMRRLRDMAPPEERARWSRIPATDRGPTAADQLAELALTENLLRDDLRPIESAEALAGLKAARELTTEQLAEHLGLELTKTKRLLQLAGAPPAIRTAMGRGLMVEVEAEPGAKPRREHRHLELSHALLILKAHGHWTKTKPKKAADLTRALIERVLQEGWPHRRLKEHVDNLVDGKPSATEEPASEAGQGGAPADTRKGSAPFQTDDKRLVVFRGRLAESTPDERAALRGLLTELLTQLDGP